MSKKFELIPINNSGQWEIQDFDNQLEIVNDFISTLPTKVIIESEDDYQFIKGKRTTVNKYEKVIKDARKTINEIVLGKLNSQLKVVEKNLKEKSLELTENINAWKNKDKKINEEQTFAILKIVIETPNDYHIIKKVLDDNGIKYEEIKSKGEN